MPSANKTVNLGLNQWLGNEFPKRQDFVDDNLIIDTEIKDLKDKVGSGLTATNVAIVDTTNVFASTNVEGALLENKTSILELQNNDGELATLQTTNKTNLVSAINELFQSASSGKNLIATSITGKGVVASGSDEYSVLAGKIDNINLGKKWANGTTNKGSGFLSFTTVHNATINGAYLEVRGLSFKPSTVIAFGYDTYNATYVVLTSHTDNNYNLPTAKVNFYSNTENRSGICINIKVTGNCATFNDGFKVPISWSPDSTYYGGNTFTWIAYE